MNKTDCLYCGKKFTDDEETVVHVTFPDDGFVHVKCREEMLSRPLGPTERELREREGR